MKKSWAEICSLTKIFNEAFSLQTSYKKLSKRKNRNRKSHKKMIWWRFLVINARWINNARSSMRWNEKWWSMWSRINWKKSEKTSQSVSRYLLLIVSMQMQMQMKNVKNVVILLILVRTFSNLMIWMTRRLSSMFHLAKNFVANFFSTKKRKSEISSLENRKSRLKKHVN
jgi:hypothetical protein